MPSSTPRLLSPVCEEICHKLPIKTALDIGVGLGKWGMLIREYCEAYSYLRFTPDEWRCVVHGIEIHEKYLNPAHHVYYNQIFIGDATEIISTLTTSYDLIVMLDVIEHIEKNKALKLLEVMRRIGKNVIVSYCNSEQGKVRDNVFESHISKWRVEDFAPKKVLVKGVLCGSEFAAVLL